MNSRKSHAIPVIPNSCKKKTQAGTQRNQKYSLRRKQKHVFSQPVVLLGGRLAAIGEAMGTIVAQSFSEMMEIRFWSRGFELSTAEFANTLGE
ncbi:MAG: hypothetical protein HY017_25975 [Betaproteobacteria bacterium]|nr:hypothetical protein [Betaproteobacteria bacterium]